MLQRFLVTLQLTTSITIPANSITTPASQIISPIQVETSSSVAVSYSVRLYVNKQNELVMDQLSTVAADYIVCSDTVFCV